MKKISVLVLVAIMLLVFSGVAFAEDKNTLEFKSETLYRSVVAYEPDFETQYLGYEVLQGNQGHICQVEIGNLLFKQGQKITFTELKKYKIKIYSKEIVLKTAEGTLTKGLNQIEVKVGPMGKYRFNIEVKEVLSKRIDKKKFNWVKVEKPLLKWFTKAKYGKKFLKSTIALGETKPVDEVVYGIGYSSLNGTTHKTKNTKLVVGINTLSTTPFVQCVKERKYWFRWDFTFEVKEPTVSTTPSTSTSVTPSTTVTPSTSASVTPSTTAGTSDDELPKTGEENPMLAIIIGVVLVVVGVGIFAKKKLC